MDDIQPQEVQAAPARRNKGRGRAIALVLALLIIVAGAVFFLNRQQQSVLPEGAEGEQLTESQVQDIVEKVGRHLILPQGETPIVATVVDAATLRASQPFYQNVNNGDYLLIYESQARAILYDPRNDLLVNVGGIQTGDTGPSPAPETEEEPASGEEVQ